MEPVVRLYRVVTQAGRDLGSLEQDFVDRLVENMSSFLLGGRAWTVERVNHADRVVMVREAPRGVKPSWGGYIPQMLGFALCQRIKKVLTDEVSYPYVNDAARRHLEEQRGDLGELLRRGGPAIQLDEGQARWWTFAGGRVNHTIKYGIEVAEGWKVVADNFLVRIEGDGVTHETVRAAVRRIAGGEFWEAAETRRAILARLPGYRLSKFQDCLPEGFALEVVANYLLDVGRTMQWLQESAL
jgi:ATP-dependent Lhr-like helicase